MFDMLEVNKSFDAGDDARQSNMGGDSGVLGSARTNKHK